MPSVDPIIVSEGESSIVQIDHDAGRVYKAYKDTYAALGDFEREVYHLDLLYGNCWFPQLLEVDTRNREITMEYAGVQVTRDCLPGSWRMQAELILDSLAFYGICHNDVRPENILVGEGSLTLIDFQWALPVATQVPRTWPKRLGGKWRAFGLATWFFDDRMSLYRSLEAVENGAAR